MAGHDGYTRYTTRIPNALYERIKAAAGEKSVNAEIVSTLEEKYPAVDSLDRTADAVVELLTAKFPRNAFGADLEERIRNILVENMPAWGVRVSNSSAAITPDFTLQNPETGEEIPVEVKKRRRRIVSDLGVHPDDAPEQESSSDEPPKPMGAVPPKK